MALCTRTDIASNNSQDRDNHAATQWLQSGDWEAFGHLITFALSPVPEEATYRSARARRRQSARPALSGFYPGEAREDRVFHILRHDQTSLTTFIVTSAISGDVTVKRLRVCQQRKADSNIKLVLFSMHDTKTLKHFIQMQPVIESALRRAHCGHDKRYSILEESAKKTVLFIGSTGRRI